MTRIGNVGGLRHDLPRHEFSDSEALAIEQWLGSREPLSIPAVAWYEFLCGSTEEDERLAFALLTGGILPFTPAEAQVAASVFRSLQKPRRLRVDAMIAATAIVAKAPLAESEGCRGL